jgi:hypothetical protein
MSEKKMITSLTPEQEAMIDVYVNKYLNLVNSGAYLDVYKHESVSALINWQYEYSGFKKPMVILAQNPFEAQLINQYLMRSYPKEIDKYLETPEENVEERKRLYDIVQKKIAKGMRKTSDGNYTHNYIFTANVFTNVLLGWWGYMIDVLKLESDVNDVFLKWRELYENAGVYNCICNDTVAITSAYPKAIHRNEGNELHCLTGPAVEWDGVPWKCYYINGRNIPEKEYEMALKGKVTSAIYHKETNEDIRAAWYEILGQEKMLDILGAAEMDRGTFVHNDGSVEEVILYKTKKSYPETGNNPYAWVRFICPSTGTKYLIDVDPKWNDARQAAVSTSPLVTNVEDYKFDGRA